MEGASLFFFAFIGFLILAVICRATFRIDAQVRNQEATIFLLMKLWEKKGADPKEIEGFKKRYKNK